MLASSRYDAHPFAPDVGVVLPWRVLSRSSVVMRRFLLNSIVGFDTEFMTHTFRHNRPTTLAIITLCSATDCFVVDVPALLRRSTPASLDRAFG